MTERRRAERRPPLSLRARLLAGLVAITAIFLVVLGIASTVVLKNRLAVQFDAQLRLALTRTPVQLANSSPGGDVAAIVSRGTGQSAPLTPEPESGGLQSALTQLTAPTAKQLFTGRSAVDLRLPDGTGVRAVARPVPRAKVLGAGVTVPVGQPVFQVVARPLKYRDSPVSGVVLAELITGGALIVLLAICGRWLIDRGLAPLRRMAAAAHSITTGGDLTARMPGADPVTEAGQLGLAINTMLDRIQYAFTDRWNSEQKVRRFAADASHELRTPLTTIRGYAELYRQGALGPDELSRAMRRIEEESTRMGQLVAELLELARLDRSSSLNLTRCDLAAIVADAAADAMAVQPGRPVQVDAPPQLPAVVDEPRIRQVLANLLSNVREHTSPGIPVLLRLVPVDHGVLLEVADAGPGMTPVDAARAFDRFHRGARNGNPAADGAAAGDAAGDGAKTAPGSPSPDGPNGPDATLGTSVGAGGAGLGLSIVQAIAAAHGGHATLESAPGCGTTVRVWLPTLPHPRPPAPAHTPAPADTGDRGAFGAL